MEYELNISKEKVTKTIVCKKCGEIIPSDEEEAVKHVIRKHGEVRGTFIHNIARTYFKKAPNPKQKE